MLFTRILLRIIQSLPKDVFFTFQHNLIEHLMTIGAVGFLLRVSGQLPAYLFNLFDVELI